MNKETSWRCSQCGGWFSKMWGSICNGCREENRKHAELIKALKEVKAK